MSDIEFINNTLKKYLEHKDFKEYDSLIEAILKDDVPISAKYNLWSLIMNHGTEKLCVENLSNQLFNFYSSDKNIEAYLNKIVNFNPKLGSISIESKSRQDMKLDYSLSIDLPVKIDNAAHIMKRVKEVLTMILIESRTVSP